MDTRLEQDFNEWVADTRLNYEMIDKIPGHIERVTKLREEVEAQQKEIFEATKINPGRRLNLKNIRGYKSVMKSHDEAIGALSWIINYLKELKGNLEIGDTYD